MTNSWLASLCINTSAVELLEALLTHLLVSSSNKNVAEPLDESLGCSRQKIILKVVMVSASPASVAEVKVCSWRFLKAPCCSRFFFWHTEMA